MVNGSDYIAKGCQCNCCNVAIGQCDEFGFRHNALVPMTHSLEAPGGPLKYSLDGHDFAVFGCALTTDQRYVISTSTRYEFRRHPFQLQRAFIGPDGFYLKVI